MKNKKQLLALLLAVCLLAACLTGCGGGDTPDPTPSVAPSDEQGGDTLQVVDYAGEVKLNMASGTAKAEVTVKTFVDGDTTHFNVPSSVMSGGVLKGRYLAVNTPESTGKIEEYGKKAARFVKETLEGADSIIIESETATWDADSTGSRFLVWVWYKTDDMADYRNLNIELLQNGLAIASSSANNQYGETCMAAIDQAKAQKLHVYSGQKDPEFYYGEAVELTLKELRTHTEDYGGMKVAFEGVVTMNNANSVYVEEYDSETGMYYGMAIYYGYNLNGAGLEIINVGNRVRIVGSLQYYEAGGTWQVSDLNYRQMKPDDPGNIQKLGEGYEAAFVLVDPQTFASGTVTIVEEEGEAVYDYAHLAMNTSVEMKDLKVVDIWTTVNEESSSKGAMTLTCEAPDGTRISIRTVVLYDKDGNLVKEDAYQGKTITVKGLVDYYSGTYQIKVFSADHITVNN